MKLTCDLCGGALQMTKDGQSAVCTQCGIAYPMERLREGLPPQRLTHDLRLARARAVIVDSAKALPGQPKN